MTGARLALDTSILVYFVDSADTARCARAQEVVRRASSTDCCVLAFQSVGEFYAAVTRRRLQTPVEVANQARDWMFLFPIAEPTAADAHAALAVAATGGLSYWDALLLTTLGRAGCTALLSEDMHDGAIILAGVTVCDPFQGDALPEHVSIVLA